MEIINFSVWLKPLCALRVGYTGKNDHSFHTLFSKVVHYQMAAAVIISNPLSSVYTGILQMWPLLPRRPIKPVTSTGRQLQSPWKTTTRALKLVAVQAIGYPSLYTTSLSVWVCIPRHCTPRLVTFSTTKQHCMKCQEPSHLTMVCIAQLQSSELLQPLERLCVLSHT